MYRADAEAVLTFLTTAEGGRRTPAHSGYRPAHLVRPDYWTSGIQKFVDAEIVRPGESVSAVLTFTTPEVYPRSLWIGKVIPFAEGSRVVGHARITKVLNPVLQGSENLDG